MHPARDEDRTTLERAEPAHPSGLDVVSESPIVASLRREHVGQIVSSFSMSLVAAGQGVFCGEHFSSLCRFGCAQSIVEACVPRMEPSGHVHQQTRNWGSMTRDIGMMADWIVAQGVTPITMESGSMASEVMGVSARAMIQALRAGEKDPAPMADLARRSLRGKIPELQKALAGHLTEHTVSCCGGCGKN